MKRNNYPHSSIEKCRTDNWKVVDRKLKKHLINNPADIQTKYQVDIRKDYQVDIRKDYQVGYTYRR